jgi:hypothetical protein
LRYSIQCKRINQLHNQHSPGKVEQTGKYRPYLLTSCLQAGRGKHGR